MKYRCKICGYIYDETKESIKFKDLDDSFICPKCNVPKALLEQSSSEIDEIEEDIKSVSIYKDNLSISRVLNKCINCGLCKKTCILKEGMDFGKDNLLCVNCGQCVQTCPVKALVPKNDLDLFFKAKEEGRIVIGYISPATRVAFGDIFGLEPGTFTVGKLVGFLKQMGFNYVLDTATGADLTIMEEASELIDRLTNNKPLPMFTSCCPSWVKYCEQFYPKLIPNLSKCKSPIGMMGQLVRNIFVKNKNIDIADIYTVAITPCTAKKYEIKKDLDKGTDLVLTLHELEDYIKDNNIKYEDIRERSFDDFGSASGAGIIFGNTGGVMEAALRTASYLLTGEDKDDDSIYFKQVHGYNGVREANVILGDHKLNIAIVDGMSNAKDILEEVKCGSSKYQYIEIMNCVGGCIGGGGQPKINLANEENVKSRRIEGLYNIDKSLNIRTSYQNNDIVNAYKELFKEPLSMESERYLHTEFTNRVEEDRY